MAGWLDDLSALFGSGAAPPPAADPSIDPLTGLPAGVSRMPSMPRGGPVERVPMMQDDSGQSVPRYQAPARALAPAPPASAEMGEVPPPVTPSPLVPGTPAMPAMPRGGPPDRSPTMTDDYGNTVPRYSRAASPVPTLPSQAEMGGPPASRIEGVAGPMSGPAAASPAAAPAGTPIEGALRTITPPPAVVPPNFAPARPPTPVGLPARVPPGGQPAPAQAAPGAALSATPSGAAPFAPPPGAAVAPAAAQPAPAAAPAAPAGGGDTVSGVQINPITRQIARAEGTGQNPNASASGVGQFLNSTWMEMVTRHGAEVGINPAVIQRAAAGDQEARRQILALRSQESVALPLLERFRQSNVARMQQLGIQNPSPADQYMASFLGADGGSAFLRAMQQNPNRPVDELIPRHILEANTYGTGAQRSSPFYDFGRNGQDQRTRTLGEVYAWAQRRMGAPGGGAGGAQVASAGGAAGVTPGTAAAPGAAPGAAAGTPAASSPNQRLIEQALARMEADRTARGEERTRSRSDTLNRALIAGGLGLMARGTQGSTTPGNPFAAGVAAGGTAALGELARGDTRAAELRREDAADNRSSLTAAISARPRHFSAQGAVYQDDPLAGTVTQVGQAPPVWHNPITITETGPDGQPRQRVVQFDSRGQQRDVGEGRTGSPSGAGAAGGRGTSLERNTALFQRVHPELTEAQALDMARSRAGEQEPMQRNRALTAARGLRDSANQPYAPDVQTRIADAYVRWFRGGASGDLESEIRQALPQPQQAQPGAISRAIDSITRAFGGAAAPPAAAGRDASAPARAAPAQSAPASAPGAAEAATPPAANRPQPNPQQRTTLLNQARSALARGVSQQRVLDMLRDQGVTLTPADGISTGQ